MNISKNIDGNTMNIALEGRLDTTTSPRLEEEVRADIGGITELNFDLAALEYISSAGLRVILRLRKQDSELKVTNVSSEVYEIFDMTGFTEMMEIALKTAVRTEVSE